MNKLLLININIKCISFSLPTSYLFEKHYVLIYLVQYLITNIIGVFKAYLLLCISYTIFMSKNEYFSNYAIHCVRLV